MTISQARHGSAYYDDQSLDYRDYWTDRAYEHAAEVLAIRRLLDGRSFEHAVDIGGGYGRIALVLSDFASRVTLVDSSQQQLDLAGIFLAGQPRIERCRADAAHLRLPDDCADLVAMIRVLHHLPDPAAEFAELRRVLRPGGLALIEVANGAHAVNRVRYLLRRRPVPLNPVDIRSAAIRELGGIPFVNHHPVTIVGQLRSAGLELDRMLSVSNLRHRALTRALPPAALLAVEAALQERFAPVYFGPSMFLLLKRAGPGR